MELRNWEINRIQFCGLFLLSENEQLWTLFTSDAEATQLLQFGSLTFHILGAVEVNATQIS